MGMVRPADFTLKITLPPVSGNGAAMSIDVIPGYQRGQRVASLSRSMTACGDALIWTLRFTTAMGYLVLRRDSCGTEEIMPRPLPVVTDSGRVQRAVPVGV